MVTRSSHFHQTTAKRLADSARKRTPPRASPPQLRLRRDVPSDADPHQERPLDDPDIELRMLRMLADLLYAGDAPRSQFERLGIPYEGQITHEHLLVSAQAERAQALTEPIPAEKDLPGDEIFKRPVLELLRDPALRPLLDKYLPDVNHTELVAFPAATTLLDLVRFAIIPVGTLRSLSSNLQDL
ncbi:hypothetical protein ACFYM3_43720 [Streptomyces massasporeus]|uniref:Type II secretion system protein GspE N-terminal domain-containing protein n=1 Tax=Streptomyces massasporeus TaxID=67324 RepID=A0ABW6LSK5_9ACTN